MSVDLQLTTRRCNHGVPAAKYILLPIKLLKPAISYTVTPHRREDGSTNIRWANVVQAPWSRKLVAVVGRFSYLNSRMFV
jgi:hypothetical protein